MEELFSLFRDVEASGLALAIRKSVWLFPIVDTAHILGIALLIGSIICLDLRMVGAWKSVPAHVLSRVVVPVAGSGLVLTLCTGVLLFITKASRYALNPMFQIKMVLITVAVANLALLHHSKAWKAVQKGEEPARGLFWAGLVSLLGWTGTLIAGRMIAYW